MKIEYLFPISWHCLVITALVAVVFLLLRKRKIALPVFTVGVYLALAFLLMLKSWITSGAYDVYTFLKTAYDSLDVFKLDYDFDHLTEFTEQVLGADYRAYAAFLFILAPVLTISNVLSFFQTVVDRVRYLIFPGKKYILSELNAESIALAESIREEHPYAQIVFTGMGNPKKKYDTKLLERAKEIGALCLKKDIVQLGYRIPLRTNRIYLISRHEPENVADALNLIGRYKNKNCKMDIYVFTASADAKLAIDEADKGESLLASGFCQYLNKEMKPYLDKNKCWDKERILDFAVNAPLESSFSVRCVDMAEMTVRNLLEDHFEAIREKAKETKTVSITILGFGRHGSALLKTAVWLFQLYGYQLQINIFDKDGTARRKLQQEAPELLQNPGSTHEDDADHDILFIGGDSGSNCFHCDFDDQCAVHWERLKKTQLVFVSLGDDSSNIVAATHVRELFLRNQIKAELAQTSTSERKTKIKALNKQNQTVPKKEFPFICAMVTDPARFSNFTDESHGKEAKGNYNIYNITPAGRMTAVYCLDNIEKLTKLERLALRCHLQWCVKSILNQKEKTDAEDVIKNLVDDTQRFMRNSYFRDSSVAMAIHQLHMLRIQRDFEEKERTEKRMITEHMRWNAYMRSIGYQKSEIRSDRLKLHPLIVPYDDLDPKEKEKDLVEFREEEIKCIFPNLSIPPV